MKIPHLFEEDQQRLVLAEYNNLQGIGKLVEWDLFRPVHRMRVVVAAVPGITSSSSGTISPE